MTYFEFKDSIVHSLSAREYGPVRRADHMAVTMAKLEGAVLYFVSVYDVDRFPEPDVFDQISADLGAYRKIGEEKGFRNIICVNVLAGEVITAQARALVDGGEEYYSQPIYQMNLAVGLLERSLHYNDKQPVDSLNLLGLVYSAIEGHKEKPPMPQLTSESRGARSGVVINRRTITPVAGLLLVINVLVFLIMLFSGVGESAEGLLAFGALYKPYVLAGQWYRLFTAMFVHIGIAHLAVNCLYLFIFGSGLERYLGGVKLLFIYLISGLVGCIAMLMFSRGVSAGASGAIYGLVGALMAISYREKRAVSGYSFYMLLMFAICGLGFGFLMPNVGNFAHIGGFIAGGVIGAFVKLNDN